MRKLPIMVNKVTPYAWDDSMSVYEMIGKIVNKINEVVKLFNDEVADQISKELAEQLKDFTIEQIRELMLTGQVADFIITEIEKILGVSLSEHIENTFNPISKDVEFIKNLDKGTNQTLQLVGEIPSQSYSETNNFSGMQGATLVNGTRLYVAMSAKAGYPSTNGLLMEFSYPSMELLRSNTFPFYHGNSVTYKPNYKGKRVLIISHTQQDSSNLNRVTVIDVDSFTFMEYINLPAYVYTLGYDSEKQQYVGIGSSIHFFDENFDLIKTLPNVTIPGTLQSNAVHNNVIIALRSHPNTLSLIDENGKLFATYKLDFLGELENCIPLGSGKFMLGVNTHVGDGYILSFYTLDISNKTGVISMLNKNELEPFTGDILTKVQKLVGMGITSGKILVLKNSTNIPEIYSNHGAYLEFDVWKGSSKIYLKVYNFTVTATIMYIGQISESKVNWRSIPLTDPNSQPISPIKGDLITEVKKVVARGIMNGKILFTIGSTNLPPTYTDAYVTFNAWHGSNKIYLEAINFTETATIMYIGQISDSNVTWRSIPLTDPNQPIT